MFQMIHVHDHSQWEFHKMPHLHQVEMLLF